MNVVLDSNRFRQDIGLRSSRISVLLEYLRRMESKLVVPQIVWEELAANYERLVGLVVTDIAEDKLFVTSELIVHPNIEVIVEMVVVNSKKSIRHVVTTAGSVEK